MLFVLLIGVLGLVGCEASPESRFLTKIDWMEQGEWVKADTHIHTRFSDGAHSIDEIALKAKEFECDVIAITDHADRNLSAATPEYAEAIRAARRSHPELIILAGLEWNVPPWVGDDHATVLVPPGPDEFLTLAEFKSRFDDLGREEHTSERAFAGFEWLSQVQTSADARPLVMLNHPSRAVDDSEEVIDYFTAWRKQTDVIVGFSGAPGHQKSAGSYRGKVSLMDRWDPAAAEVGGTWDQLLGLGEDLWAARAPSDFHSPKMDYWPGEFSETWLYVPNRTPEGVLKAYRAGAFFAGHGHIARNVELKIQTEGLPRAAYAGETVAVSAGSDLTIELGLGIPDTDWEGRPNQIDQIELIAVTSQGARIIANEPVASGQAFKRELTDLREGFVLRARGRRIVPDGPDLLFYTNPIRVVTEEETIWTRSWKVISGWVTWRRLGGIGISLLLIWALGTWIYQRLDEREDVPKDAEPPPPPTVPQGTPPRRWHVFLAAMGFLLLAIYGSFVPLSFRSISFEQAWEQFWYSQPWGQINLGNRSDWGANVLLYIPISFFCLGVWCLDRKSLIGKISGALFVVGFCLATSLVIEFLQSWIRPRVPSHNDVYAQMVGTLIGIVAWLGFGQILVNWWRLHTSKHHHHRLLAAVLSAYVLGLLAYSFIPLDFVIHPAEIYRKYRAGRIALVPDWQAGLSQETLWRIMSGVITFIPVGVWSAIIWCDDRQKRTWFRSVLIGGSVVLGIETFQVFLLSRYAEILDVFIGLLGVAIGSGSVWHFQSQPAQAATFEDRKLLRTLSWFGAAILYAGFLVCFFCWPFEVEHDPIRIQKAWSRFFRVPMTALYWSSEYNAATQILRKLFLWSVLGMMVSQPMWKSPLPKALRRLFLFLAWIMCAAIGFGIELLQLMMPGHTPDSTDVGLYALGTALGIWGARWWQRQSSSLKSGGSLVSRTSVSSPG